jgi:hypothetical protein
MSESNGDIRSSGKRGGEDSELSKDVKRDRALTHAVVVVDVESLDDLVAGEIIEAALKELNDRSLASGMVILSTTLSQSSYVLPSTCKGHVVLTIVCQWVERDKLERMQAQQRLMGGGPIR